MIKKIAGICLLASVSLLPLQSIAKDTTTDSAGQYVDDAKITAKVKGEFAKDKLIKGRDISVRTDKGVVDLTGVVTSKAESDRATDIATKVKAVTAVHNNLSVKQ